jgi:hypothetical protein
MKIQMMARMDNDTERPMMAAPDTPPAGCGVSVLVLFNAVGAGIELLVELEISPLLVGAGIELLAELEISSLLVGRMDEVLLLVGEL